MGPVHALARESAVFQQSPHFPERWEYRLERGRRRRSDSEHKEESPPLKRDPTLFLVIAGAEHEELPETLQRRRRRPFRSHETHDL